MRIIFLCLLSVFARLHLPSKPVNSLGLRSRPVSNYSSTFFVRKSHVSSSVKLLWNLTDDVVGKITSISLNVQANVLLTGSTFTPVTQVTALSLDTGKVLSKASPDNQFSYATAISEDASVSAVYGCASQPPKECTLAVYKGSNVSAVPVWREKIKGYQWWGAIGMKISAAASLIAVAALKSFPQEVEPVAAEVRWFNLQSGDVVGNYSSKLSLGEVWLSDTLVATREIEGSNGYLRFLSTANSTSNCSVEADFVSLSVSNSLSTVAQPFVDSRKNVFASQQKGGLQCASSWQWALPTGQTLLTVGTSDVASVFAALNALTVTFYVFPASSSSSSSSLFGGTSDPPEPVSFSVVVPSGSPVQFTEDDIHYAFSSNGIHLGISVSGLGLYYVNLQSAPSSPVHVYSDNNPCGSLSMAIESDSNGDVFIVTDFNQVVDISPTELDCVDGGNGLSAFKIFV